MPGNILKRSFRKRKTTKISMKKLTFSITYYPAFQNVRSIMGELYILLTLHKEHKKVFPVAPAVAGFWNGFGMTRALTVTWLELNYPNLRRVEDVNHVGKKICFVCDSISTTTTFTTKACQETFKIQKGPLNYDSEKVLYLLKCKVCNAVPCVGKAKTKFRYSFINYKRKHSEKVTKKFLRNIFTLIIVSMATVELIIGIL